MQPQTLSNNVPFASLQSYLDLLLASLADQLPPMR